MCVCGHMCAFGWCVGKYVCVIIILLSRIVGVCMFLNTYVLKYLCECVVFISLQYIQLYVCSFAAFFECLFVVLHSLFNTTKSLHFYTVNWWRAKLLNETYNIFFYCYTQTDMQTTLARVLIDWKIVSKKKKEKEENNCTSKTQKIFSQVYYVSSLLSLLFLFLLLLRSKKNKLIGLQQLYQVVCWL